MREHLSSGWEIPGEPAGEKPAPATKWLLQVNTWGDRQVYFNMYKDGGRR
jgi:hypothetical protein